MILSVYIDLAFAEPNDVVVIEKPKWCNSANISYYYTLDGIPGRIQISMCYIYVKIYNFYTSVIFI